MDYYQFEVQYKQLIVDILDDGQKVTGRNGKTTSLFAKTLTFDLSGGYFPILTSRKMFYKGVFGEYAAMIRGPKHVDDFKMWGCNYWDTWADETGRLTIDYGNKWKDFGGVNQVDKVIDALKNNPTDRRMIITGWDPSCLDELSLPCCHYSYQFYVNNGYLELLWNQRSADTMIGIPSDAIFAASMLLSFAGSCGLKPGKCTMVFGDTHIYEEHLLMALDYVAADIHVPPHYDFTPRAHPKLFLPRDITLHNYSHCNAINFELKA